MDFFGESFLLEEPYERKEDCRYRVCIHVIDALKENAVQALDLD